LKKIHREINPFNAGLPGATFDWSASKKSKTGGPIKNPLLKRKINEADLFVF